MIRWFCGACLMAYPEVSGETDESNPQCPGCGAALMAVHESSTVVAHIVTGPTDPRRQHRDDPRIARARDEREHKPH